MAEPVLLTHELANLGRLNINLYGVASEFYLQAAKDGLIDYLKRVDHLGFISKSHPGNHHKRWDYVCLQLFLLQKLRHKSFNTGLAKNTTVGSKQVSNLELVQLFVLLANIGHLEGTIATEKALFDYLKANEKHRNDFLSAFKNYPELMTVATQMFNGHNPYNLKYLIALNYALQKSNETVIDAIHSIFELYISQVDEVSKLRNIYYRVRRVCFVYLDSHHCHTPMQLNIAKILINVFNYDELFNPIETDYDKILDDSETILTKQIYISPISSLAFKLNYDSFFQYLKLYSVGGKQIDFRTFLLSLVTNNRRIKFELKNPTPEFFCLQFYLSKDAFRIGDMPLIRDLEGFTSRLYAMRHNLDRILHRKVKKSNASIVIQHDMRGTLLFFTFLFKKQPSITEFKYVFKNYGDAMREILNLIVISEDMLMAPFNDILTRNLKKDLIRRFFLYILQMLLQKQDELNLYVKFEFKQEPRKHNKDFNKPWLFEASHSKNLQSLEKYLDGILMLAIPNHIKNNITLLKIISSQYCQMKGNVDYYYLILPVDIEKKVYDPSDLDKGGHAEQREVITDVDCMLVAIGENSTEIFVVEGKDLATGFKTKCKENLDRIKSMSNYPSLFQDPVIISNASPKAKGGFLKIVLH